MKKFVASFIALLTITSFAFISCEKESSETSSSSTTTTTCKDSAYLFADSLSCSGKSVFHVYGNNRNIIMTNSIVAIDTIVNGASFYITYDSTGTEGCGGVLLTKAVITCYQRR